MFAAVIPARGLGTKHIFRPPSWLPGLDRSTESAVMFVEKALANLLGDRDIRRSHNAELKAACEKVLADLRERSSRAKVEEGSQNGEEHHHSRASVLPELDATFPVDMETLFKPFELACQSRWGGMAQIWARKENPNCGSC